MDRDRRYGWRNEERWGGREEERGGRGFGARDRDEDWRQRGGYFGGGGGQGGGGEREDEWRAAREVPGMRREGDEWRSERERDFGPYGQQYGRGYEGGGYSSREWERDRDRYESSRSAGYGQMGLGTQGGFGSSQGLRGGYPTHEGSWGSTGREPGYRQPGGMGERGEWRGHRESSRELGPYGASYGTGYGGGGAGGAGSTGQSAWPYSQHGAGGTGLPGGYGSGVRGSTGMGGYGGTTGYGGGYGHGAERADRGPFFGKGPKGYKRSDERVREEVCEAIARQGYIDASEVEVRVQNGEVTLSGQVRERDHKRHLEQMIEDLPGVEDVRNELRVTRGEASAAMQGRGASTTATTSSEDNGGGRGGRTRTS